MRIVKNLNYFWTAHNININKKLENKKAKKTKNIQNANFAKIVD